MGMIVRPLRKLEGLFVFVQHERTLTGESPQRALIAGSVQPKARVSVARRNLKEASGKRLARWTRTWYKA